MNGELFNVAQQNDHLAFDRAKGVQLAQTPDTQSHGLLRVQVRRSHE